MCLRLRSGRKRRIKMNTIVLLLVLFTSIGGARPSVQTKEKEDIFPEVIPRSPNAKGLHCKDAVLEYIRGSHLKVTMENLPTKRILHCTERPWRKKLFDMPIRVIEPTYLDGKLFSAGIFIAVTTSDKPNLNELIRRGQTLFRRFKILRNFLVSKYGKFIVLPTRRDEKHYQISIIMQWRNIPDATMEIIINALIPPFRLDGDPVFTIVALHIRRVKLVEKASKIMDSVKEHSEPIEW